ELARAADEAGIDRVVVSDHVVFGEDLEAYARPEAGGVDGGKQPTGPDGHWLEPITVLTTVAARTTRVRLGTYVLLAALRRPAASPCGSADGATSAWRSGSPGSRTAGSHGPRTPPTRSPASRACGPRSTPPAATAPGSPSSHRCPRSTGCLPTPRRASPTSWPTFARRRRSP